MQRLERPAGEKEGKQVAPAHLSLLDRELGGGNSKSCHVAWCGAEGSTGRPSMQITADRVRSPSAGYSVKSSTQIAGFTPQRLYKAETFIVPFNRWGDSEALRVSKLSLHFSVYLELSSAR